MRPQKRICNPLQKKNCAPILNAMKKRPAFERVVAWFGGVPNLAAKTGLTHQAIYTWRRRFPVARAYQIEILTRGEITAAEILNEQEVA